MKSKKSKELEVKPKKKKRKTNIPVESFEIGDLVKEPKKKKKTSKKDKIKKIEQRIEKRKSEIMEYAVEAHLIPDDAPEKKYFDEFEHIFKSLQKLTRIAERKYKDSKSSRDVYALMAMYSQIRECIADMRTIQDLSQQSDALIKEIIDPLIKTIGDSLVQLYYNTDQSVRETITEDKLVQEISRRIKSVFSQQAVSIQKAQEDSKAKVYEYFSVSK